MNDYEQWLFDNYYSMSDDDIDIDYNLSQADIQISLDKECEPCECLI